MPDGLGLRAALCSQPSLRALAELLDRWFGFEVGPIDAGCDESGVPSILHEIAELARSFQGDISHTWQSAGTMSDAGDVVIETRSGPGTWCRPGSLAEPVITYRPGKQGTVEIADRLDDYLLSSFLFEAGLNAPVRLHATTNTVEDALEFLSRYEKVMDNGEVSGTYAGSDILISYLAPLGTLWPEPRLHLFGRSRAPVEAALTETLRHRSWRRLDQIYEPATDTVLGTSHPPFTVDPARRSGEELDAALLPADAVLAVRRFLSAWYGLDLPAPPPGSALPEMLAALHRLNISYPVTGTPYGLLDAAGVEQATGVDVEFYATEGGSCSSYRRDLPDHPVTTRSPPEFAPVASGASLDEFLLSLVLKAAINGAPVHASTTIWDRGVAEAALADFELVRPQTPGTDAVYATTTAVAQVRHRPKSVAVSVAAHTRDAIAETSLRSAGGWHWFYGDPPTEEEIRRALDDPNSNWRRKSTST